MKSNFIYENDVRLRELSKKYFDEGKIDRLWLFDADELNVYKYILCFRILSDKKIDPNVLRDLKFSALLLDRSVENRIFFEKVEFFTKDILYFRNFMQNLEEKHEFLSTWRKLFVKAA